MFDSGVQKDDGSIQPPLPPPPLPPDFTAASLAVGARRSCTIFRTENRHANKGPVTAQDR